MNLSSNKVVDNFLPKVDFDKLRTVIYDLHFPWFYQEIVEGVEGQGNYCYFTHLLLNDGFQNSERLADVLNILKPHFEWKMIGRIKCNLYPGTDKLIEHKDHVDAAWSHNGILLSMNTCDGVTVLEDGTKINSVENRALFFDPGKPHHSTNTTNAKARINININYF
jgi:hypothetical protein